MAIRPAAAPPTGSVARPGVLSLNIRERAALYAAYMPFLKGGGIFIPTSREYKLGEEVFMLLSLMDDPNRIAVQGKVVWITPEGVQGNRTQGIGVQFTQDETGAAARPTIEKFLGESLASQRPTVRSYSVSSLQRYAACPYQFLLHAIYGLSPLEEPEPLQRMDPLTKGSLFHQVPKEDLEKEGYGEYLTLFQKP